MPFAYHSITPTEEDASIARRSSRTLSKHLKSGEVLKVELLGKGGSNDSIELSPSVSSLLLSILEGIAEGTTLTLIPEESELSTSQAAEILGVSRPFFVKLLEEGEISYRQVGSHRRVGMKDLLEYKERTRRKRREALEQLAMDAQELDMGY